MIVVVDIEADGPLYGVHSMISFGAVIIRKDLTLTSFYGQLKPVGDQYIPDALAVSGHSREETLSFKDPEEVMKEFAEWLTGNLTGEKDRPIMYSDNNGFDFGWINYYFHRFIGNNPFGHTSMNISSLYKGLTKNMSSNFKHLKKTKHTHHPVDDATGNAEALVAMNIMGLKLRF
jgi:DNA polymerase III alpha subunit (gram-positive type)